MANAVTRNYLNRIAMQPAVGGDEGCGGGRDGGMDGGRECVWKDRVRSRKVGRRCEGNKREWKGWPAICVSLEREIGSKISTIIML